MALSRNALPSLGPRAPSMAALAVLESALSSLRISKSAFPAATLVSRRHASHQAQGRANGAKDGAGKRLGAKKTGGEYVIPGNIIFKQRGTHWFPGDNCYMGRDHTIHAGQPGYIRYYRDPLRHPKRKFIGVVFEKDQQLPQPPNAVRRRKLGMLAYQAPSPVTIQATADLLTESEANVEDDAFTAHLSTVREEPNETRGRKAETIRSTGQVVGRGLTLRPGYQYREANWEIGRAAERSRAAQRVQPFKPGDRFAAWRKTTLRKAANAERRSMGRGGKKKKA